jgi:hypothetical protein
MLSVNAKLKSLTLSFFVPCLIKGRDFPKPPENDKRVGEDACAGGGKEEKKRDLQEKSLGNGLHLRRT